MASSDDLKREAAKAALGEVRSGMKLGLGTGSTARHFVDLLGAEVRRGLNCIGVPTSEATARQARDLGIPLATLEEEPELDLTIDGADEIGPGLGLIKGAGGALLREKIVAAASKRMIVIADQTKVVEVLGQFPLPIEVDGFGLGSTTRKLEAILREFGALGGLVMRMGRDAEPYRTDGGHLILDASFGRISGPEALATALSAVPGVVEHGLFLGLCKRAYVAGADGVEVLDA